ncbi:MAG: SDR family oxidoreductase [Clostridiales bacterium]|nr:SDR family oxidoreductase [Clostridiales bacterium]
MPHVLISGGSRGIGRAAAELFANNGWLVTCLYHTKTPVFGNNIAGIRCDVSNSILVTHAVQEAESKFGPIDCLISNAGISVKGLAQDFKENDYRKVMDTNFGGLFNLANAAIPGMVSRKKGVIIAVSSMWGQTGASCEALYSASKGAVDAYVRSLAKELGPSGIRVNAVSPGVINTDMLKDYSDKDLQDLAETTPLGRLGSPEEVAKAMLFLSSDGASFITGQIIGVNGGFLT